MSKVYKVLSYWHISFPDPIAQPHTMPSSLIPAVASFGPTPSKPQSRGCRDCDLFCARSQMPNCGPFGTGLLIFPKFRVRSFSPMVENQLFSLKVGRKSEPPGFWGAVRQHIWEAWEMDSPMKPVISPVGTGHSRKTYSRVKDGSRRMFTKP